MMPWLKVDDSLATHPKARAAGLRAMGLWVLAGSYCARYLTNGLVTRETLRLLGASPHDAQRLVDAGLWEPDLDGWRFHDWEQYQPSRDSIEARRQASAERQSRWRRARPP